MTVGERNKKMNLTGVPETMLQTIYARAKESKGRGAICDKKAEEIVSRLDYDFSLADKDTAMHSYCPHHCAGSFDNGVAGNASRWRCG